MNADDPIKADNKKEINKTESKIEKKTWKKKSNRYKTKSNIEKVAETKNKSVILESKTPIHPASQKSSTTKRYSTRIKKSNYAGRRHPSENPLLQDVPSHELEKAKQLNQLPSMAATRALKFPGLNASQAKNELIREIRSYLDKTKHEQIILGLSGGLDSALTAGLVAEAVGRTHLQLIHFIESEKSNLEKARAELIAKSLGVTVEVRDCRPQVEQHCKELKINNDISRHSLLCRERMTSIMTTAEQNNALVITGVNKTKWILGYNTLHGDLIGQLNPIGDLYHSQVLTLAKAINVPKLILDFGHLNPLLPGLTRQEELIVNWKEADFYLYQMMDVKLSLAYLMTLGVDETKVKFLYNRIRHSGYMRQLTTIPKLSQAYDPYSGDSV